MFVSSIETDTPLAIAQGSGIMYSQLGVEEQLIYANEQDDGAGTFFGMSISIYQNFLLVGAIYASFPNGDYRYGAAYIFTLNNQSTWSLEATLSKKKKRAVFQEHF